MIPFKSIIKQCAKFIATIMYISLKDSVWSNPNWKKFTFLIFLARIFIHSITRKWLGWDVASYLGFQLLREVKDCTIWFGAVVHLV